MRRPMGFSSSATACSTSRSAICLRCTRDRSGRSEPEASSAARLRATSSRMGLGTTSSTRPSRRALDGRTDLPVRMRSSASAIPISRGSRCVPPAPGMSPSCTSGCPSCVFRSSLATRYVHASATSRPPPSAGPWMAATIGLRFPSSSSRAMACCPPLESASASSRVLIRWSICTSAPAMNPSGLPLAKTMEVIAGSSAARRSNSSSSPWKSARSVLTGSPGTSISTTPTPSPWPSRRKVEECMSTPGSGCMPRRGRRRRRWTPARSPARAPTSRAAPGAPAARRWRRTDGRARSTRRSG